MRNFISKKHILKDVYIDYKIKNYINMYIKELQRHFDVSDKKMTSILYDVYCDLNPSGFIKKILYAKM
ncbi:MAG: hypothetical protein IKR34_02630, partial [Candidatus Gastranaerophilales bacterium]|nr:hypothetical protein [Candidatus Gastranaerophilales bacterium]